MSTGTPRHRPPRPPKAPLRPIARVLVVDSDPTGLAALGDALDGAGILSVRVRTAEAALAHPDRASVSAVVCALELPRLDGLGFLLQFRADPATAALPVIIVSRRPAEEVAPLVERFGAAATLGRPVDGEALVALVRRLVDAG